MPRFRLLLEYDGRPFVGWQRQANGASVQAALEAALAGLTGETVVVSAAGRTDAGVHALAMPVHVDLVRDFAPERLQGGLNHYLRPLPVVVLAAEAVAPDFHARFSARARAYVYRILNRRAPPALEAGRVWHVAVPLDPGAMRAAAATLVGRHDFTSYRAAACQAASPVKTLSRLDVRADGPSITVRAAAPSFLHHQVRNLVGTLKLIGEGRAAPDFALNALNARDRRAAGPTAPGDGLHFVAARYPDGWATARGFGGETPEDFA